MGSAKSDIMKSRKNLKSTCLKTVEPKAVKCPIQDGEAKWHMRLLFPVLAHGCPYSLRINSVCQLQQDGHTDTSRRRASCQCAARRLSASSG